MPIPSGDPLETTIAAVASSDSVVVAVGQAEDNPGRASSGRLPHGARVLARDRRRGRSCSARPTRRATPRRCRPTGTSASSGPTSVASGDGRFVAGGSVAPPSGNPACDASAHVAVDRRRQFVARVGRRPSRQGGAGRVEAVTYDSSSGFVAVGATYADECGGQSTAALWGSPDGATWRQYALPAGTDALGVAASDDLVVVMGVGTKVRRGGCDAVFWTSDGPRRVVDHRRQHPRARGRHRRARRRFVRRLRVGVQRRTGRSSRSRTA